MCRHVQCTCMLTMYTKSNFMTSVLTLQRRKDKKLAKKQETVGLKPYLHGHRKQLAEKKHHQNWNQCSENPK